MRTAGLLERDRELDALTAALDAARTGSGGLVLINGAAGLGKTALIEEARERALAAGMLVLSDRGDELERDRPWGLVGRLFGQLPATADRASWFEGAARPALSVLDDAEDDLGQTFGDPWPLVHGLFWVTANVAAQQPLALLIDDAHWSDEMSLRFVRYLQPRLRDLRVAVVVACRPREPGSERLQLELIASDEDADTRPLNPLSADAARRLLGAELGSEVEPAVAEVCATVSGGNPFFLHELARELRSRQRAGVRLTPELVRELTPAAVLRAVYVRLTRLGDGATALARAVAVLGDRAAFPQATELAGLTNDAASQALDLLASAEILAGHEPLHFVHPLVAAAVYEDLPAGERGDLHLRAAAGLARAGAAPEDVASQLLPAGCRADAEVVSTLEVAAHHALSRGAPEAAATYLERALREPPDAGQRARILTELGRLEGRLVRPTADQRFAAALELTSDPPARADLLLERGRALATQGDHAGAADAFTAGLAEIEGETTETARELWAAWWMSARLVPGERPEMPDAELELTGDAELTPGQRQLLAQLALQRALEGAPREQLIELAERSWGEGALLAAETSDGLAWSLVTAAMLYADSLERELEICDLVLADARRRGSPMAYATVSYVRAIPLLGCGRIDDAIADAQTPVDARRDGWSTFVGAAASVLALAQIERGSLADARAVLATVENDPAVLASIEYMLVMGAQARLLLAEGQAADALQLLQRCGEMAQATGFDVTPVYSWRAEGAIAASVLGRHEQARELAAAALQWALGTGSQSAVAQAHRARGYAERGEAAVAAFRAALDALEGAPPRLQRVYAMVDLGAALRRVHRRAEAMTALTEGLRLARASGAQPLAERALTELAAAGTRTARHSRTGVHALTPSERRVAKLAADGHSNREIAQLLFVTVKAVEYHLANTYRKLGISGRGGLAASLAEAE